MSWIKYIRDFIVGCYSVLRRFGGSVYGRVLAPTDDMAGESTGKYGRGYSSGQDSRYRHHSDDNLSPNKRQTTEAIINEKGENSNHAFGFGQVFRPCNYESCIVIKVSLCQEVMAWKTT